MKQLLALIAALISVAAGAKDISDMTITEASLVYQARNDAPRMAYVHGVLDGAATAAGVEIIGDVDNPAVIRYLVEKIDACNGRYTRQQIMDNIVAIALKSDATEMPIRVAAAISARAFLRACVQVSGS